MAKKQNYDEHLHSISNHENQLCKLQHNLGTKRIGDQKQ